jgi:hypothetical protein
MSSFVVLVVSAKLAVSQKPPERVARRIETNRRCMQTSDEHSTVELRKYEGREEIQAGT